MVPFWIIAIAVFLVSTLLLVKFTLKDQRKQAGEKVWRYAYGRSVYWRILSLCSFGITAVVLLLMHWVGISFI